MNIEQIETRMAEIKIELDKPEADLDALQEEVRKLNEQRETLRKEAEAAEQRRLEIANGAGTTIEEHKEDKPMDVNEIRSSAEYLKAFANYLRTEDDRECRALIKTENASGKVPVPVMVDEIVRHAWERDEILNRCRKTNFRGNLKVSFEKAGDVAYVHTEGTSAPTEESLELGIVTMVPANIKKWIKIPDEVAAMDEAMVRYVYEELTHQILKKLADLVVADIAGLETSNQNTSVGAAKITMAPGLTTIPTAYANLSDEATEPVIIMNKLTYAAFVAAHAAGNFAVDPFMGLPVLYNNSLPAYSSASDNAVYAIVGDLKGAQLNYPEGENVVIKWDDLTLAEEDLIKIVGRQYVAHAVTAPFAFTRIAKPAAATT